MRFLFVNPPTGARTTGVNHGIAALAPIPRKYGFDVSCIHLVDEVSDRDFLALVDQHQPDVVGFSGTSHQYAGLRRYSNALGERRPELLQIAGGVHPTLDPEGTLRQTRARGVCVGEGEVALEGLMARIRDGGSLEDAPGFTWKTPSGVVKNPPPPMAEDIGRFDFPDYTVFDRDFVVRELDKDNLGRSLVIEDEDSVRYIEIMLSRGCPYNCHYCLNGALASVVASSGGKYFRVPPVDYAIRLVENVLRQYPTVQHIEFLDDLLIANKRWFHEFAREYKRRIGLPYRTNGRFECITPDIVALLKESGCQRMFFGLESGNEWIRKHVCNRKHTNDVILERLQMVKDAGIEIQTLNIIGFPFETKEQMRETLQLNRRIAPHFGTTFFFHPYKGTELHRMCADAGLLHDATFYDAVDNNSVRPFIKLSHAEEKDCIAFQRKMSFYFFTQTSKYRIRRMMNSRRGVARAAALPIAAAKLVLKGARIYLQDYVINRWRFGGTPAPVCVPNA